MFCSLFFFHLEYFSIFEVWQRTLMHIVKLHNCTLRLVYLKNSYQDRLEVHLGMVFYATEDFLVQECEWTYLKQTGLSGQNLSF